MPPVPPCGFAIERCSRRPRGASKRKAYGNLVLVDQGSCLALQHRPSLLLCHVNKWFFRTGAVSGPPLAQLELEHLGGEVVHPCAGIASARLAASLVVQLCGGSTDTPQQMCYTASRSRASARQDSGRKDQRGCKVANGEVARLLGAWDLGGARRN